MCMMVYEKMLYKKIQKTTNSLYITEKTWYNYNERRRLKCSTL